MIVRQHPLAAVQRLCDTGPSQTRNSALISAIATNFPSRDGGTGRRSGLKIRRPSGLGGSTPPPGTMIPKQLRLSPGIAHAPGKVQVCANCEYSASNPTWIRQKARSTLGTGKRVEQGSSFCGSEAPCGSQELLASSQKENCKNCKTSIPFQMGWTQSRLASGPRGVYSLTW